MQFPFCFHLFQGVFSIFLVQFILFYLSGVLGRSPRLPRGSGVWCVGVSRFEIHAGRRLDMFSPFGVVFDIWICVKDMYF